MTPSALPIAGDCDKSLAIPKHWLEAQLSGQWHDWRWQFRNRVQSYGELSAIVPDLLEKELAMRSLTDANLPFAITPYYLTLLDPCDPNDPVRLTMIPSSDELVKSPHELADPCGEDAHMPVDGLVHRYPDRVLFLLTDTCAVYCRYCTRSRVVGSHTLRPNLEEIYAYLEAHTEIRDVLLSGGDPLIFSEEKLEPIIARLRQIKHIDIIRVGTKIPIVMPQRITDSFVSMLKQYHPFYMSIHIIHPNEITPEVTTALNRLADAGIPTFSQTVLLKDINDDPQTIKTLVHALLRCRVKPYYLYQCDPVEGTGHFRTRVESGLQIIENLRGHTTGYGIPSYVIDGPGGGGKIPLSPSYVVEQDTDKWVLRNYNHQTFTYHQPDP
ncbi:MAG: KamA family radical SAM protein [Cyanobacteria bacterium HKST-UBA04]|nr:KamA family radical SAM protein [Cyanobacteria bacterium HKST-UBA04]